MILKGADPASTFVKHFTNDYFIMKRILIKLDVPPVKEFLEMIVAGGGEIYACKLAADMFKLRKDDLTEEVIDIITVGKFYELAGGQGSQIIFV